MYHSKVRSIVTDVYNGYFRTLWPENFKFTRDNALLRDMHSLWHDDCPKEKAEAFLAQLDEEFTAEFGQAYKNTVGALELKSKPLCIDTVYKQLNKKNLFSYDRAYKFLSGVQQEGSNCTYDLKGQPISTGGVKLTEASSKAFVINKAPNRFIRLAGRLMKGDGRYTKPCEANNKGLYVTVYVFQGIKGLEATYRGALDVRFENKVVAGFRAMGFTGRVEQIFDRAKNMTSVIVFEKDFLGPFLTPIEIMQVTKDEKVFNSMLKAEVDKAYGVYQEKQKVHEVAMNDLNRAADRLNTLRKAYEIINENAAK